MGTRAAGLRPVAGRLPAGAEEALVAQSGQHHVNRLLGGQGAGVDHNSASVGRSYGSSDAREAGLLAPGDLGLRHGEDRKFDALAIEGWHRRNMVSSLRDSEVAKCGGCGYEKRPLWGAKGQSDVAGTGLGQSTATPSPAEVKRRAAWVVWGKARKLPVDRLIEVEPRRGLSVCDVKGRGLIPIECSKLWAIVFTV